MPPTPDRGHMALSSTYWWSRIWIFYVELTVSEATQSCPEKVGICSKNYDWRLSFWLKPRFWVVSTISCEVQGSPTTFWLHMSRELTHRLNLNSHSFPSYTSLLLLSLSFTSSNTFLPHSSHGGYFFCACAQRSFESRQSQERTKLKYQTRTEQPKWQDYDTESPLADEGNERWKWVRGEIHPFSWRKHLTAWRSRL